MKSIEKQTMSVPEVAAYLGLSMSGTNNLFHSEGFPSFRIKGRIMVTKAAFEEWLKEQQKKNRMTAGDNL